MLFVYKHSLSEIVCLKIGKDEEFFQKLFLRGILYTVGWSDFSLLWNFEKKQVGIVKFGKKICFH